MLYRCKNSFKLNKYRIIKKGSKWEENGHKIVLLYGIEDVIHLDQVNGSKWIEISRERFEECFEEVK